MFADDHDRAEIIKIASAMTSKRSDADEVLRNAGPIVDWVEQARSEDQLRSRMTALAQHYRNVFVAGDEEQMGEGIMDDPQAFLVGVTKLFRFTAANHARPEVPDYVPDWVESGEDDGAEGT